MNIVPGIATSTRVTALSLLALAACGSDGVDAELEPWLEKAREMYSESRAQLEARWGAPMADSWGRDPKSGQGVFADLHHGKLFWFTKQRIDLVADAQLVGSYQSDPNPPADAPEEEGSWKWSWYNESVPDIARQRIDAVRRWGLARRSIKFTKGGWVGPRSWAHDMMVASARVLGSAGSYTTRVGKDTELFFILQEVRKPKKGEVPLPPPKKGQAGPKAPSVEKQDDTGDKKAVGGK